MKTKLMLLATVLLLASCSNTTQLNKTENSKIYKLTDGLNAFGSLGLIDYKTKGMHYDVFQTSSGGIDIINVTMDSLNVVKLKQDIKNGH